MKSKGVEELEKKELKDIQMEYWEKAAAEISKRNPASFGKYFIHKNAMNGVKKFGIEFYCVVNSKKRNLAANSIATGIYIDVGKYRGRFRNYEKSKTVNKEIFKLLFDNKEKIDASIPGLVWNENPSKRASSIQIAKEIDFTDENNWSECIEFQSSAATTIYDVVFKPYINDIEKIFYGE